MISHFRMEWSMDRSIRYMSVVCVLVSLAGCVSFGVDTRQRIVGQWQSEVAGFPVTVAYTDSTVTVGGGPAVNYHLDGDRLTFDDGGTQVRIVSFPSRQEMVQTDPMTGTEQRYRLLAANP